MAPVRPGTKPKPPLWFLLFGADSDDRITRTLIVCGSFVLFLGTAVFVSGMMSARTVSRNPDLGHADKIVDGRQTGHTLVPLPDQKTCRSYVFDRSTGEIIDTVTGPCGTISLPGAPARQGDAARASSYTQREFRWGQRGPGAE